MASSQRISVGEVALQVSIAGSAEPVLWIQTALTADELVPVAGAVADTGRYLSIVPHRRGYAGSDATGVTSIAEHAHDCRCLLDVLGYRSAHVVGLSFAATVALQLAVDHPDLVASLCLIDPPPVHGTAAVQFAEANADLLRDYRQRGANAALDRFLTMQLGPHWRAALDATLPGSAAQAQHDARAFFGSDIPALLSWSFSAVQAAAVRSPTLCIGGGASGAWFEQSRTWLGTVIADTEQAMLPAAGHDLALTHVREVAGLILGFLHRHPLP